MTQDTFELAKAYEASEKIENAIERRTRQAQISCLFELDFAEKQIAEARSTPKYAIETDQDVASIQGWIDNLRRVTDRRDLLGAQITLLTRIVGE